MPPHRPQSLNFLKSALQARRPITAATIAAVIFFLAGLGNEPFADEYAYLTQSYFTDLLLDGKLNDPAWLEYPAYDLPPLPKYLIGLSLHAARQPIPSRTAAFLWYEDINRKFGGPESLAAARVPSILLGALGCLALYEIGRMVKDRRTGWFAFIFLLINPLYGLLARRAMSDVPCEALAIGSLACALRAWLEFQTGRAGSVRSWSAAGLAGALAGGALLCKFSGLLALMISAAWCTLGLILPGRGWTNKTALAVAAAAAAALASILFVALNPFMYAHPAASLAADSARLERMDPWERFRFQMDLRTRVAAGQQQIFPHNALVEPIEKVKTTAVQGFGRFGPLGKHGWSSTEKTSEQRYAWSQDWGALVWGPLVGLGFIAAFRLGRRQLARGEPPTGWITVIWAVVTFGVVAVYIPLAWDRYLLPIQGVSSLLAALALSAGCDVLIRPRPTAELVTGEFASGEPATAEPGESEA